MSASCTLVSRCESGVGVVSKPQVCVSSGTCPSRSIDLNRRRAAVTSDASTTESATRNHRVVDCCDNVAPPQLGTSPSAIVVVLLATESPIPALPSSQHRQIHHSNESPATAPSHHRRVPTVPPTSSHNRHRKPPRDPHFRPSEP
ncbi:hypothetical protein E2542_SST27855 [Spatholobus suberectus]|nr:hypothetical protein E2542_SST27855 [Spatholobus suberectus]